MLYRCLTFYLHHKWDHRQGDRRLLPCLLQCLCPLSQQKRYEMLYGTQTRRDDLLFTSMIDPSFLPSMVGSKRIFSMDDLNILCLWPNWFCANKCRVSFALFKTNAHARQGLYNSKQQATAFDHMCCYNQFKLKVSQRNFKVEHKKVLL